MIYSVHVFDEMTMDSLAVFEGTMEECNVYIAELDEDIDFDILIED